MKTLLAVSPHLDDAVFSAGALLARHAAAGWRVVVATCFTASVPNPAGFALACQLDKGLGPEVDYMALRRAEDETACAAIGAESIHLPLPEAPHRGYDCAPALFGPRLEGDDVVATELAAALRKLFDGTEPDQLLGPACIGDHVDHWIVREALEQVAGRPLSLWADLPYAARSSAPLTATPLQIPCGPALARKLAASACYVTQVGLQFGSPDAMANLLQVGGAEHFSGPIAN